MNNARLLALVPVLASVGCKEYFTVDEACTDALPGGNNLTQLEREAMLRVNCHRRLAGVAKTPANEQVVEAARDMLQYVLQNPNVSALGGEEREHFWLTQSAGKPGFTGLGLYERLTDPGTGTGYVFYDILASSWWEYIDIVWTDGTAEELPSGADAVDMLMRNAEFRQAALQPSMLDGGYAELDLPEAWFEAWTQSYPESPPPVAARAYYFAGIFTAPHIEHANEPLVYPKQDQTGVPLWGLSSTLIGSSGKNALTGYPVTFQVGTVDPKYFLPVDQNQYGAAILGATIQGPEGLVETRNIVPGTDVLGTMSDGIWLRNTLSVVPVEPLQPGTKYSLAAEVQTPEATFLVDFDFTTAQDDPGFDAGRQATVGTEPVTTTTTTY